MEPIRVVCVAAILYNTHDQVLLLQRDDKPGLEFAGYWTLPGGRVEENEMPDAAIQRELREEIEAEPELKGWKIYDRLHHKQIDNRPIVIEQHIYSGHFEVNPSEIKLNEGQASGFFTIGEIPGLPIGYGFDRLLIEFLISNRS